MVSVYSNSAGSFAIEVSPPSPMWVTIQWESDELHGIKIEDLRDLRHLIDRAIAAAEARDRQ